MFSSFLFKPDMSAKDKNLSVQKEFRAVSTSQYRIGIVVSEYHDEITSALKSACIYALIKYGVKEKNIFVQQVPGAFELPLAAKWIFEKRKLHAVVAIGCVIKGETDHDKYINNSVSQALMNLGLQKNAPFVFGVLTPNNLQQAKDRSGGKHGNKGHECALAVLKMLALK